MKIRSLLMFVMICYQISSQAQSIEITGKISASDEVDGIHVINKTASRFTTSNEYGEFKIPAKLNDTILFSGISYLPKEIVVTKLIMASRQMSVYLEEQINALDEVVVGKILTGDLHADILNAEIKPEINFYDLGIPGYTGRLLTQTERRLFEATSGSGLIPVVPIINAITGRTKMLKAHVKQEKLDNCLDKIKSGFAEDLFSMFPLEEAFHTEFFYYCQDDPEFEKYCKSSNTMTTFEFLQSKLKAYKSIIQSEKK